MPFLQKSKIIKSYQCEESERYITFKLDNNELIKTLKPPREFPEHLLVITPYYPSAHKFFSLYHELRKFEIPFKYEPSKELYIGFYKKKNTFVPYVFRPNDFQSELVLVEKGVDKKRYFLKKDNYYYIAEGNLLESIFEDNQRLINKLRSNYGQKVNPKKMPVGLYEGILPIYPFNHELNFNRETIRGDLIVKTSNIKTMHQLIFTHPDQEKFIRESIKVYENELIGRPYPKIKIGDTVVITNPKSKKRALKGEKGIVKQIRAGELYIEFLGYFQEIFSIDEISTR